MDHPRRIERVRIAIVGSLACALLQVGSPARAEDAAYTDALIPLVTLPAEEFPPAVDLDVKGISWNGVVLATQPVRPAAAIVIDESLGKPSAKRVLFLTLTGKIDADWREPPAGAAVSAQQVWCRDTVNPNAASIDCYKDTDGDGKLDQRARGYLPRLEALSLNRIGSFEAIDAIAYRVAAPADLPAFDIDYLLCRPVAAQLKFYRRIRKAGILGSSVGGQCDSFASPVADQAAGESVFLLDQVRIKVRTVNGVRMSQMSQGMPAGSLIGQLRTDYPVAGIAQAESFTETRAAELAASPDVYISTAPTVAKEPVRIGEKVFAAEVRHTLMGTLRDAAVQIKLFKGAPNELIPAGARMFGIRMKSNAHRADLDADIVWCYPAPLNSQRTGARCIARNGQNAARVVDVRPRFDLEDIGYGSSDPLIATPTIDRAGIDFGEPVVLEIAVEKVAKKWIAIRYSLDRLSERNKSSRYLEVERAKDGKARVLVGNGMLVLESSGEEMVRVSEEIPVTAGSFVVVDDVIALQRELRRRQ